MTIAALGSALVGKFHDSTSRIMAIAIGLSGMLALLAYTGVVRAGGRRLAASERANHVDS